MYRYDIINELIKKYDYKSYLEIGTQNKDNCFNKIECNIKMCVDPDPNAKAHYVLTSDDYFDTNKNKFDIIFIDGLHHWRQVQKDIENSLQCLNKNGIIVVHDCNPIERLHQVVPRISKIWNGDTWISWVKLRQEGINAEMFVIDTDYGVGIIKPNEEWIEAIKINLDLNFSNLEKNRKYWLNLISVEEFNKWLTK